MAGARGVPVDVPDFIREIVEEIAFHARADQKVDKRSGVSQRLPITTLENVVSNAERRALVNNESVAVPRVSDIYASLPSLTGKIELEYEGELKGAEHVARELVRQAIATVFDGHAAMIEGKPIVEWFENGGTLELSDTSPASVLLQAVEPVKGLSRAIAALGVKESRASEPHSASVADFVLEGLCALRKITRTDEGRLLGTPSAGRAKQQEARNLEQLMDDDEPVGKGKKKYYN
jgi:magnesium chelatase subunit I